MTYANDVLVSTDWVEAHRDDRTVVLAEVDEETGLYAEGHIPGAVALHWRAELQQQVVRDVIGRQEFEARPRASATRRRSCSTATRTTRLRPTRTGT
jgi:3-mercaptopyruvate sulfurtransferase SseA